MNQINKYAKIHFAFLYKFGYSLIEKEDDNAISFVGEKNQIEIIFSTISYEITCHFIDNDGNIFSLQDGLEYKSIQEYKGFYQIPSKGEMEKGIIYLAEAVKILFQKIDISTSLNFQKIYQFSIDTNKELLKKYYIKVDNQDEKIKKSIDDKLDLNLKNRIFQETGIFSLLLRISSI